MSGVEALLGLGGEIIKRVWPDPAQQASAQLELLKLQQSGELAKIVGQLEINKAEAASTSLFVAGWRPAIGWVCATALAYQYVGRPIGSYVAQIYNVNLGEMPTLDSTLWELMFGMLGLGGLRTFEKVQGVAAK
jgi:hypothetical protein